MAGCLCFNDALALVIEQARQPLGADQSTKDEQLKQFESFADKFNYYPPNLPLVCSLSGDVVPVHRSLGGSYWRDHCIAEPAVSQSVSALSEINCGYVLEIGAASQSDVSINEIAAKPLQSLMPTQHASTSLLNTLGRLYAAGVSPAFSNLNKHRKCNRISLPTYPFQKKRYWITEIDQHVKNQEVGTVKANMKMKPNRVKKMKNTT